jgi:hypothetical protein
MIIGIDFDNTITCYDRLFHRLAMERHLIPGALPMQKEAIRDYLRTQGLEDAWTELQGLAYGVRIGEAEPFPGVERFFSDCRDRGVAVTVISHKTRLPVRGPQVDLRQAARSWLSARGFHDPAGIGLPPSRVYLEETKEAKLQRIVECGCTHFLDDLPEFLELPDFPPGIQRLLFDPWRRRGESPHWVTLSSWDAVCRWLATVTLP